MNDKSQGLLPAKRLKIALGDLRHSTAGRHSAIMPIGIGYIASYLLTNSDSSCLEIHFYTDPDLLLKDIECWGPDVIGLSSYSWNAELSNLIFRYAKKIDPRIVCVAGGPEFPTEQGECKGLLLKRKEIDFFVYREGEIAFTRLINELQRGNALVDLKSEPQDGIMSIHPGTGELIVGKLIPRIKNLDDISSPFLNGVMDQWFDGRYIPALQTARGCPFSCGYCKLGEEWYTMMARFSIERVQKELEYIFEKIKPFSDSVSVLYIFDADFGMTVRDENIAGHIAYLRNKFSWPIAFNLFNGRAHYDRVMRIASLLQNRAYVSVSVQSMNPKTSEIIKRKNLRLEKYRLRFDEM